MKAHLIFSLLLLCIACPDRALLAQEADSLALARSESDTIATDTAKAVEKPGFFNFKADYPNPKKAVILSLVVPGAGQLYNKRFWKLPLVYGALGGIILVVDFNQSRYRRFRDALNLKREDMEHEFTGTQLDDIATLRNLRDVYDKRTQTAYIFTVIVYGLQAMEAFVDAHLKGFDVEDDLGFRIKPTFDPVISPTGVSPGMGIGLTVPLYSRTPANERLPGRLP